MQIATIDFYKSLTVRRLAIRANFATGLHKRVCTFAVRKNALLWRRSITGTSAIAMNMGMSISTGMSTDTGTNITTTITGRKGTG